MPATPRFVDLTHMVSVVPGDECETIFCNKMRPKAVNRITRTPDLINCGRCRARLIREAMEHAGYARSKPRRRRGD